MIAPLGRMSGLFRGLTASVSPTLCALCLAVVAPSVCRAEIFTNVYTVNVLPSGFSVFCQTPPEAEVGIDVYSDAAGTKSLAGRVGIVTNAVRGGSAEAVGAFDGRSSMRRIQADMEAAGLSLFRITDCTPGSNVFFRLWAQTNGVPAGVWPTDGTPRPVAMQTANRMLPDSRQLIVHVPGADVSGWVGLVEHEAARDPLAAVVGDLAGPSELYFELGNFFGEDGTNLVFSEGETFTIAVYGAPMGVQTERDIDVAFGTNTVVAESFSLIADATYLLVRIGSTSILSNVSQADVPIDIVSAPQTTNLSFELTIPASALTNLAVDAVSASVGDARVESLGGDRWRIVLESAGGGTMHSTSLIPDTLARLRFSPLPDVQTVLIPLDPMSLLALAATNRLVTGGVSVGGEIRLIARQPFVQWGTDAPYGILVSGIPGAEYAVEYSTNLLSNIWVEDSTFTLDEDSFVTTVQMPEREDLRLFIRIREKTLP